MKLLTTPIMYSLAGLVVAGALATGVQSLRLAWCKTSAAEQSAAHAAQVVAATEAARVTERRQAQIIADISEQYERDRSNAKARTDRLIADLRAGVVRLHDSWAGICGVPGTAPTASELDGCARDREASAARIVAAAAAADAQITGLQAVVVADRR